MTENALDNIEITILPGKTKDGSLEKYESITFHPGETISIVGPTGSGKTAFINDIEVFAQNDTITGRTVLVNGNIPPENYTRDPAFKPIAMITQNTKCLADLTVRDFLAMHIRARGNTTENVLKGTIDLANKFTGEKIVESVRISSLSGGQTRSLMIADAVMISQAPILLLDEIENAGIFKEAVIEHLRHLNKTVIFVTHDPYVALLTDKRIVMGNGEVKSVVTPGDKERETIEYIEKMDSILSGIRERIRVGEIIYGE